MDETKVKNSTARWWDFLSALLFLIAMLTAATRLVAAQWVPNLNLVQVVAVLGAISGLALGQSRFNRFIAFLFGLCYGVFVVPWQLGLTMGDNIAWMERVTSMAGRIQIIISDLLYRKPITDNLFFLLLMAALFWFVSVYGGYQLMRYGSIWLAILPAGVATFVIHTFDPLLPRRSWYLAAYIFLVLLLVARVSFLQQKRKWEANRTHIPPDASLDLARIATGLSAVIILVAWNFPVLNHAFPVISDLWLTANQPWLTLKDKMSFAFSSLRATVGLVADSYGDQQVLGLGSVHSNSVVMVVNAPSNPYPGVRYYWQARVYDTYADGVWQTTLKDTRIYSPAEQALNQGPTKGRTEALFTFTPYTSIVSLYTVPQVEWVSRPGKIQFGVNPDQTVDVVNVTAQPFIKPGEDYQEKALLGSFTEADLQKAGTNYPVWITTRYLELPPDITDRTIALAHSIAQGKTNPYDIAKAVTQYLRQNIKYSETINSIPSRVEPIDWFLFDSKIGFCNYYATAEVVLLRALGIPARFAVGYAEGTRQISATEAQQYQGILPQGSIPATFTVTQADSHAWPEVYFPGIGWIEFEPTVSQNPLLRPSGTEGTGIPAAVSTPSDPSVLQNRNRSTTPQPTPADNATASQGITPAVIFFLAIFVVAIGIIAYALFARNKRLQAARRGRLLAPRLKPLPVRLEKGMQRLGIHPPKFLIQWARYSMLPVLYRAYSEINYALNRLGKPPAQSSTPTERKDALVKLIPLTEKPAQKLVSAYEASMYSDHSKEIPEARQDGYEIRRLSYLAKLKAIWARIQRPEMIIELFRGNHES